MKQNISDMSKHANSLKNLSYRWIFEQICLLPVLHMLLPWYMSSWYILLYICSCAMIYQTYMSDWCQHVSNTPGAFVLTWCQHVSNTPGVFVLASPSLGNDALPFLFGLFVFANPSLDKGGLVGSLPCLDGCEVFILLPLLVIHISLVQADSLLFFRFLNTKACRRSIHFLDTALNTSSAPFPLPPRSSTWRVYVLLIENVPALSKMAPSS